MARSNQGRFQVEIYDIRCRDLDAKDISGTSDPFVKAVFDNYKRFETDVVKRDLNPRWHDHIRFEYTTQHRDTLDKKMFFLKVLDWDRMSSDDDIGFASTTLHDLATGPIEHKLTLLLKHKRAGEIIFKCKMVEVVETIIKVREFFLLDVPTSKGSTYSVFLRVSFKRGGKTEAFSNSSSFDSGNAGPHILQPLKVTQSLDGLLEGDLVLEVVSASAEQQVLGSTVLPLAEYCPLVERDRFNAEFKMGNTTCSLRGLIDFEKFPMTHQMLQGERIDDRVEGGEMFHPLVEKPRLKLVNLKESRELQSAKGISVPTIAVTKSKERSPENPFGPSASIESSTVAFGALSMSQSESNPPVVPYSTESYSAPPSETQPSAPLSVSDPSLLEAVGTTPAPSYDTSTPEAKQGVQESEYTSYAAAVSPVIAPASALSQHSAQSIPSEAPSEQSRAGSYVPGPEKQYFPTPQPSAPYDSSASYASNASQMPHHGSFIASPQQSYQGHQGQHQGYPAQQPFQGYSGHTQSHPAQQSYHAQHTYHAQYGYQPQPQAYQQPNPHYHAQPQYQSNWQESPLPAGYEQKWDNKGKTFYVDHFLKRTQWERPQSLPPGWERARKNGKVFYIDHNTRKTHWDPPQ